MKICVLGAGAIGGFVGARMVNAGIDVTFIDRGPMLEALKTKGFTVKSFMKDFAVKNLTATDDFSVLKDADIILLSVKSYSTEALAKQLKEVISKNAYVVSLQNGIENEDVLAKYLGSDRVMGAVVYISCNMPELGVINHTSMNKLVFGELDGKITPKIKNLCSIIEKAGFETEMSQCIKKELWGKLMMNAPFNGFTALIRGTMKNYHNVPEAKKCFIRTIKEVQAVAKAEGYELSDEKVQFIVDFTDSDGFLNSRSSTLGDIEAGRPVEIDVLQGAVVKFAKKHNIDVPMNELIYSIIKMGLQ